MKGISIPKIDATLRGGRGSPVFRLCLEPKTLDTGGIVSVMGANGSGKSVFLSLLAGDTICGHQIRLPADKHSTIMRLPIVRQNADFSLATSLTVLENIVIRSPAGDLRERLTPTRSMRRRAELHLIQYETLRTKLDQPVSQLSGGQRQILAFAVATLGTSRLLLLDEFLSATDLAVSRVLLTATVDYCQCFDAVALVVTHDPAWAIQHSERILVLRAGRYLADLSPSDEQWGVEALARLVSQEYEEGYHDTAPSPRVR